MEKERDDNLKDCELVMDVYTDDTDFIPISMICVENAANTKVKLRLFFRDRSQGRAKKKAKTSLESRVAEQAPFGCSKYMVFDASLLGEILKKRLSNIEHPISNIVVVMLMAGNDYLDGETNLNFLL